jgi:hypothetical protein
MHLLDTGMRRLVSVLGFLAAAVLPVANVASASVTPSRAVERRTAPTPRISSSPKTVSARIA